MLDYIMSHYQINFPRAPIRVRNHVYNYFYGFYGFKVTLVGAGLIYFVTRRAAVLSVVKLLRFRSERRTCIQLWFLTIQAKCSVTRTRRFYPGLSRLLWLCEVQYHFPLCRPLSKIFFRSGVQNVNSVLRLKLSGIQPEISRVVAKIQHVPSY